MAVVTVITPQWAQLEIERVVAKARQHPGNTEHWFRMLPAGSVDMLAMAMFTALVSEAP